MKKMILTVGLLTATLTPLFGGEGKKTVIIEAESSEKVEFTVAQQTDSTLDVHVSGVHDEMASISLVNTRGTALYYEFITQPNSDFSILLNEVPKGTYFVKLHTNGEIRMKTILVN